MGFFPAVKALPPLGPKRVGFKGKVAVAGAATLSTSRSLRSRFPQTMNCPEGSTETWLPCTPPMTRSSAKSPCALHSLMLEGSFVIKRPPENDTSVMAFA